METITTNYTTKNKVAGIAGFVFLACVVLENVLRGQPPGKEDSFEQVLDHYQTMLSQLELSHSLYIVTIPALLLYAAGLFRRVHNDASDTWARTGLSAASIMPLSFALVMISDMLLTNIAGAQSNTVTESFITAFKFHDAAFIINAAVLGTGMFCFGMAARKTKAFASWLTMLAIIGGVILIVSAIPADEVLRGSMFGMIGLAGFLSWLIWVGVTSTKMLKGS